MLDQYDDHFLLVGTRISSAVLLLVFVFLLRFGIIIYLFFHLVYLFSKIVFSPPPVWELIWEHLCSMGNVYSSHRKRLSLGIRC
ncbi:hypothetical protein FKM82_014679 [Ascaphus truei]